MFEDMKNKNGMKFQSEDTLKRVQLIIDDTDKVLKDKYRKMKDSPIVEALKVASGIEAGLDIDLSEFFCEIGKLAGGFALGGPGFLLVKYYIKNKRMREAKELLYKETIAKQTAILKALKEESDADKERIEYLNSLNTLLQAAINDLNNDLETI